MAAIILSSGTKGKRFALPNSEIMIHQPLSQAQGQATEIEIAAKHVLDLKKKAIEILSNNTGQTKERIAQDIERDHYITSETAVEYGLIDKVIDKRQ
jgi:ATP-dependent Clp protease protease subunit